MKNLFLINPLQSSGRSSYFPIGLIMLAEFLRKNGVEISFFDRNAFHYKDSRQDLAACDAAMIRALRRADAELAGITMMTGHFDDVCHITSLIKQKAPECFILSGGSHPTFEPERSLAQIPGLDLVVCGPGEMPVLQICQGVSCDKIPNIVYRKGNNGAVVRNPVRKNVRIDWSSPAYDLIDAEFYWSDRFYHTNSTHLPGLAMMMTSQGCPGKCTFCVDDRFLGTGFYQSDQSIFEEMELLATEYGRKCFFFVDRDFRLSKKNIIRFCEKKIFSSQRSAPWTATIRADQVDEPLAKLLKQSNCIRIVLGIESGKQGVLDMLCKGTTVDQNFRAVNILNRNKILACGSFIYGLPGQTVEDVEANIDFFRSVKLFDSAVLTFLPTVGSRIYGDLVSNGRLNPDDISIWERIVDFNAPLTPDRNYSDIPFDIFEKIYHDHANEIFDTCKNNRNKMLDNYGLSHLFDYDG